MRAMGSTDARAFEGLWRLLPERCEYQHQAPPRSGTYRIRPLPDGLGFTLDWVDAAEESHHLEFELGWDRDTPASLELVDERTLNTTVEKDGRVTAHATRRLSAEGDELEIIQQGFKPSGEPFTNRAWYQRAP